MVASGGAGDKANFRRFFRQNSVLTEIAKSAAMFSGWPYSVNGFAVKQSPDAQINCLCSKTLIKRRKERNGIDRGTAFVQALRNASGGGRPVVFHRQGRRIRIPGSEPLREYVKRKPLPASVTEAYDKAVMRLWDTPICTLPLSPEAKGLLLDDFDYEQYDRQKISGEWKALENDPFISKLTGTTARLAGILHLWQEHPEEKITAATMRNAIALARYFVGHRLHLLGGENSLTPPAADALKYLTERKQAIQKERDVKRILSNRVLFKAEGTLENALDELEAVGYIHRKKEESGGRPSQLIELHPQLMPQGEEFTL